MVKIKYYICYSKVTQESVEVGDHSEHGYCDENFNEFQTEPDCIGEKAAVFHKENELIADGIRDLVNVAEKYGIYFQGDADWAHGDREAIDYRTGEATEYSLHVDNSKHWHHVMKALTR